MSISNFNIEGEKMITIISNIATLFLSSKIIDMDNRHLFFPNIVTKALLILFVLLIAVNSKKIYNAMRNLKTRDKEINIIKNWKLFLGNLALLFGYVLLLDMLGFVIATILYVFLTVVLFYGSLSKRVLTMASVISVITVSTIYIVFNMVFRITLP
jgi:hypothetical protein